MGQASSRTHVPQVEGSLFCGFKMGIQDISEEDVSSHQSYSPEDLDCTGHLGILLAILDHHVLFPDEPHELSRRKAGQFWPRQST